MSIDRHVLRQEFKEALDSKQDALLTWAGLLGDGLGNIQIVGWPGWVWVRIGHEEEVGRAFNQRVPLIEGLAVIVGYDPVQPGLFQVLSIREAYAGVGTGARVIPQVPPHGHTHEWPAVGDPASDGGDTTYISWRQMLGLRVSIDTTAAPATCTITNGQGPLFHQATGWMWVLQQSLVLQASIPLVGARYVLIYLDSTGTLQQRNGTAMAVGLLAFTDVPDVASDELALAAIYLYAGQTALRENRTYQDITDLRFPMAYQAAAAPTGGDCRILVEMGW